jgi:hypothetical protein
MILSQFAEMIVILLNNPRYILLRPAVLNVSTLFLHFNILIKLVSSLQVGTVETQSSAFLLFAVIMAVVTGVYFAFRASCLRHATSCNGRKLFYIKFELSASHK